MSVNLQMSQAMNVKMSGGGPSRMTNNAQMVPQQQQQQTPQQQQHPHPQHHHQQQQQPPSQQHPSMMRAQQQQAFTQQQQQQVTMSTGNLYQRNMAPGYGSNQHPQQYQQTNATMQPLPVTNATTSMLNTNNGLPPPRNTFSPSDFSFDFLDQPLANDNKNGFNNKQQPFGDFSFDFLDAH